MALSVITVFRATPLFAMHRSVAHQRLSSVYVVDPTTGYLRAKTNSELVVSPNLYRKFLRLVKHDDILLSSFLILPFIPSQYASNATDFFVSNLSHVIVADPFLKLLSLVQKDSCPALDSKRFHISYISVSQLPSGST